MINDLIEEINELENKGFEPLEAIEVLKLAEQRKIAETLTEIRMDLSVLNYNVRCVRNNIDNIVGYEPSRCRQGEGKHFLRIGGQIYT